MRIARAILGRLSKIENHGVKVIVCPGKKTWSMEEKNEIQ